MSKNSAKTLALVSLLLFLEQGARGQQADPMSFLNFLQPPSAGGQQVDPEIGLAFLRGGAQDAATTIQKISSDSVGQGLFAGFNKLLQDINPQAKALGDKMNAAAPEMMQQFQPNAPQSFLSQDFKAHAQEAMRDKNTQALTRSLEEGIMGELATASEEAAKEVRSVDMQPWMEAAHNMRYREKKDPTSSKELVSTQKYAEAFKLDENIPVELKEKQGELKNFIHLYRTNPIVNLDTSFGTMEVEVLLEEMPITASNFLDLCTTGFYDGIHFHRVIEKFMIQTGSPLSRDPENPLAGTGNPEPGSMYEILSGPKKGKKVRRSKKDGCIPDEFTKKISNDKFTISMANTGATNSGGSQFFINVADNPHLNWFNTRTQSNHPVFANVVAGQQVAMEISKTPRDEQDKPLDPVMLIKCSVVEPPKPAADL